MIRNTTPNATLIRKSIVLPGILVELEFALPILGLDEFGLVLFA